MNEILIGYDPNLYRVASYVRLLVDGPGPGPAETSNAREAFPARSLLGSPRQGPPEVSQEDVALESGQSGLSNRGWNFGEPGSLVPKEGNSDVHRRKECYSCSPKQARFEKNQYKPSSANHNK